jgi:hypothetical protein
MSLTTMMSEPWQRGSELQVQRRNWVKCTDVQLHYIYEYDIEVFVRRRCSSSDTDQGRESGTGSSWDQRPCMN